MKKKKKRKIVFQRTDILTRIGKILKSENHSFENIRQYRKAPKYINMKSKMKIIVEKNIEYENTLYENFRQCRKVKLIADEVLVCYKQQK